MAFRPDRPYNELPSLPPRIGDLVEAGIAQRQSASAYLKRLCEIGVLEERKTGREKLFTNPALLRVLTQTDA